MSQEDNLSIVTIGSAYSHDFILTVDSVLANKIKYHKWIFVVFNEDEIIHIKNILSSRNFSYNIPKIFCDKKGISSAMNTALNYLINIETFIWFLHAGDQAIGDLKNIVLDTKIYDFHFFPVVNSFEGQLTKKKIKYTPKDWQNIILYKPCINHQGVFTNSRLFRKFGLFSLSFTSIMDFEWFYRLAKSEILIRSCFHENPICIFRLGGKSSNIIISLKEHFRLYLIYNDSYICAFYKAFLIFIGKLFFIFKNISFEKFKSFYLNQ